MNEKYSDEVVLAALIAFYAPGRVSNFGLAQFARMRAAFAAAEAAKAKAEKAEEVLAWCKEHDYVLVSVAEAERCRAAIAAAADAKAKAAWEPTSPCAMDENEPCLTCGVPQKDHEHDYEPIALFRCLGCANDVVYDSANIGEHPDHDHDFDPVPAKAGETLPCNARIKEVAE
jgi:hypothetical protein